MSEDSKLIKKLIYKYRFLKKLKALKESFSIKLLKECLVILDSTQYNDYTPVMGSKIKIATESRNVVELISFIDTILPNCREDEYISKIPKFNRATRSLDDYLTDGYNRPVSLIDAIVVLKIKMLELVNLIESSEKHQVYYTRKLGYLTSDTIALLYCFGIVTNNS